ncbi:MAG: acyl-CoA thioester hydrolase [Ruminococcus sp.]|nr:acyl-CoA thioester hydrolase [Ruminococcus sp.]
MKKTYFSVEKDGFYGAYFKCRKDTEKAVILMLGDNIDDFMAMAGAKWVMKKDCNVMTMSPAKNDYSHHNYPLERFEKAIDFLKKQGNTKIGIAGASTTGMLALVAASYIPDITLTIAISPSDFVMEGFYRDGLDGARERPGDYESSVSYRGEPLPFLPYAYRHPEYWQMIEKEAKEGGDMVASRKLFDESERRHPLQEEEKIKVENIKGKIVFVGAEDDVLWDTCRYIRRMAERLETLPHDCVYELLTYEHGTHFAFPYSMINPLLTSLLVSFEFRVGKQFPKECRATRIDIDKKLSEIIIKW